MIITNPKIETFTPQWASLHGFSLLFDNPRESFRDDGEYVTLVTDPNIAFYAAIQRAMNEIGGILLTNKYLLAPLPYSSYHVTVWDGINDFNLPQVVEKYQDAAAQFLSGLPNSITSSNVFTQFITASALFQNQTTLTFRFDSLKIWGNDAFVATLCPIEECIPAFDKRKSQRSTLNDAFQKKFGTIAFREYCPHVSLGYFANQELAVKAGKSLAKWQVEFSKTMDQTTISFSSFSLYGFTDMATFVKAKP